MGKGEAQRTPDCEDGGRGRTWGTARHDGVGAEGGHPPRENASKRGKERAKAARRKNRDGPNYLKSNTCAFETETGRYALNKNKKGRKDMDRTVAVRLYPVQRQKLSREGESQKGGEKVLGG